MKKILSIVLVGIMSLSVFLFCGFTSYPINYEDNVYSGSVETVVAGEYVERVYFNTQLNESYIMGKLDSFYTDVGTYYLLYSPYYVLQYDKTEEVSTLILIDVDVNESVFVIALEQGISFLNGNIPDYIVIDTEIYSSFDGSNVGEFNDKLTDFISLTPYPPLDNLQYVSTTPSGYLSQIYINPISSSLFVERIENALSTLTSADYIDVGQDTIIIPLFSDGNFFNTLFLSIQAVDESSIMYTFAQQYDDEVAAPFLTYIKVFYEEEGTLIQMTGSIVNSLIFDMNYDNVSTLEFWGNDINVGIINDELGMFSSTPIVIAEPKNFVVELINDLSLVFVQYIPALASGIVSMFGDIMFVDGSLTTLGVTLLVIIGLCLVSSIFRIVYKIFKGKSNRKI